MFNLVEKISIKNNATLPFSVFSRIETRLLELFKEEIESEGSIFFEIKPIVIKKIVKYFTMKSVKNVAIAIAGETASGKSTITEDFLNTVDTFTKKYGLKNFITRINTDDYYYDRSEMVKAYGSFSEFAKNYDLDTPDALELSLMKKHIKELKNKKEVLLPVYDMSGTAKRTDNCKLATPNLIILSEGLFTLNEKLADIFDIKIYVDVKDSIQKERFIKRAKERNILNAVEEVYSNAKEKAKIHIHPTKRNADIILSGEAERQRYRDFMEKLLRVFIDYKLEKHIFND